MQIHAVSDMGSTSDTYRSIWAYRELYHGRGTTPNFYGERPYRPFPLVRNIRIMPAAFFCGLTLIVDETIARRWTEVPHVDLNPCEWEAAFDLPMDQASVEALAGRFSAVDEGFSEWLETQYRPVPASVRRHQYFQVLVPILDLIRDEAECDVQLDLPSPAYEELPPVATCATLHERHPILKTPPYFIFTDDTFAPVANAFADPELFLVKRFAIGT